MVFLEILPSAYMAGFPRAGHIRITIHTRHYLKLTFSHQEAIALHSIYTKVFTPNIYGVLTLY